MNSLRFGSRHTVTGRPAPVDARVALGVDPQRHRLAAAEETPGLLRFGQCELIVQRHSARRPIRPQTQQRLERDTERRAGLPERFPLLSSSRTYVVESSGTIVIGHAAA